MTNSTDPLQTLSEWFQGSETGLKHVRTPNALKINRNIEHEWLDIEKDSLINLMNSGGGSKEDFELQLLVQRVKRSLEVQRHK